MNDTSDSFDVIVIGSGIGGLVAALTCARAKRSVLVLEAGKQFGGYTNPFSRKHFHFDPGIHYIGEAGPGGSLRNLLDRLELQHVAFKQLDPDAFDHYVFPDYRVANCVGLERFRDRLAADFPSQRSALDRFFALVADLRFTLKVARRHKAAADWLQLAMRTPKVLRWARATASEMLAHYFSAPMLRAALAGPVGDLGLPPSRLGAVMLLGLLAHYSDGAYFPAGGSGPLRDAFVDGLRQEGAQLRRNAKVARILHDGGRVTGVRTEDGATFRARTVISNAQADATFAMVGADALSQRFQRKLATTEYSVASVVLFLGVDGALDTSKLGSSNIWHYGDNDIDATYRRGPLDDFRQSASYFLTVPSNKDPEGKLAPPGKQTVELVTLCNGAPFARWFGDKTMRRGDEYLALKEQLAEHFLALAEQHLPGLRQHLVLKEVATPATNYSFTLSSGGNIYGPALTPAQLPPFRFGPRTPIDGLLLCGSSVLGDGIVSCASSGRMAGKLALAAPRRAAVSLAPARRWLRHALS
jgi:all-trans-retinol 13,14-reductase